MEIVCHAMFRIHKPSTWSLAVDALLTKDTKRRKIRGTKIGTLIAVVGQ